MGNSQSSQQNTKIYNEMVTNIKNDMNTNFSNSFSSSTQNKCSNMVDQVIAVDGDTEITGNGVTIQNKSKASLSCMLENTSTKDIQQNLSNSLMSSIEKVLGSDTMNKLQQEAKTQLGSLLGNTNDSKTNTDVQNKTVTDIKTAINTTVENKVTNEVISEANQTIKQAILFKGKLKISGNDVTIKNEADAFLQGQQISKEINNIIGAVMNSNTVTEKLEVQNKVVNDTTQKATSTGFAEMFESIGKMISSIFTGMTAPLLIAGVVFIFIIYFKFIKGGGAQSQQPGYPSPSYPSPSYPLPGYPPPGYPPR